VVAFALLAVGGCSNPNISAAEDAVRETLKDPESAQFRNVRSVEALPPGKSNHGYIDKTHPGLPAGVCGEVNAKNGMGGYTGFSGFIWIPEQERLVLPNDEGLISMPSSGGVSRWLPWRDYCTDRVPEAPKAPEAPEAPEVAPEVVKARQAAVAKEMKKAADEAAATKCDPKLAASVGLTCK
jgi:hypothetical protein